MLSAILGDIATQLPSSLKATHEHNMTKFVFKSEIP